MFVTIFIKSLLKIEQCVLVKSLFNSIVKGNTTLILYLFSEKQLYL